MYRSFEFAEINMNKMTWSVSIATDYWLDGWGSVLGSGKKLVIFSSVQTGSRVQQASYPICTVGSFPRG
jgi:hypothetical protein